MYSWFNQITSIRIINDRRMCHKHGAKKIRSRFRRSLAKVAGVKLTGQLRSADNFPQWVFDIVSDQQKRLQTGVKSLKIILLGFGSWSSAKGSQINSTLMQLNVFIFKVWSHHSFSRFLSFLFSFASPFSSSPSPSRSGFLCLSLSPGFQLENGCCGNVESYHKCVYVKNRVGDGERERERKKRRKGTLVSDESKKKKQGVLLVE